MVEQILQTLIADGIVRPHEFQGAGDANIANLEKDLSVQLPGEYKNFLRLIGRGAGPFLTDDHWYFMVDSLSKINDDDVRSLLDEAKFRGPWFCFATRMGDVYFFFLADGSNDDPPVYFWNDGIAPRIEKGFNTFCDCIKYLIEDVF